MITRFHDRYEAGQLLAEKLYAHAYQPGTQVLALPRGGVPVAFAIAEALDAPLDVFVVRKLGVPGHEELAMGAIASGGVQVLNPAVIDGLSVSDATLDAVAEREQHELQRREAAYRDDRPMPPVRGRTVILVDDGIATGATMRAAIAALRQLGVSRLVVATPTAASSSAQEIQSEVDEFVALITPTDFAGVGERYDDFSQTSDGEVRSLLHRAETRMAADNHEPSRSADSG